MPHFVMNGRQQKQKMGTHIFQTNTQGGDAQYLQTNTQGGDAQIGEGTHNICRRTHRVGTHRLERGRTSDKDEHTQFRNLRSIIYR